MLTENEFVGITKDDFLKKYIGPEKFAKVDAAIAKWAEEKGFPMYVFVVRLSCLSDQLSMDSVLSTAY